MIPNYMWIYRIFSKSLFSVTVNEDGW